MEIDPDFNQILNNPSNHILLQRLFNDAATLVADFDTYGEVIQLNEDGVEDESTTIGKIRKTLNQIRPNTVQNPDY